jgi:uncharacterized membrane protein YbhN (UPF0104 family)
MPRGQTTGATLPGPAPTWALALAVAASATLLTLRADVASDGVAEAFSDARWSTVAAVLVLPVLAAVHFVSSAGAVRALSARRLSWRRTTQAQLAAGATNRLLPSGIGGAGVNLRYLLRSGLTAGAATSAIATLAVVAATTDAMYAAAITLFGPVIGVSGAGLEMATLAQAGQQTGHHYRWLVVALLAGVAVVVMARLRRSVVGTAVRVTREAVWHVIRLLARPWRLGAAALASTLTTAAMSAGFVVAVETWGHAPLPLPVGALTAIYLVASALGGATPLPPWLGTTELVLVGALTLAGYSAGSAVLAVVVFRTVTYWLPLPVGIWSARRLRHLALL